MQFLKELQNHTAKLSTFQNDNFIRTFANRKVIQHQSKKGSKMITQFQVLAEKKTDFPKSMWYDLPRNVMMIFFLVTLQGQ